MTDAATIRMQLRGAVQALATGLERADMSHSGTVTEILAALEDMAEAVRQFSAASGDK